MNHFFFIKNKIIFKLKYFIVKLNVYIIITKTFVRIQNELK